MKTLIQNFINDESGASAAEYALILAVIGVAIGGAALLLAGEIGSAIGESAVRVNDCATAAGDPDTAVDGCPEGALTDYTATT